eukprot:Rhum_TRINITY_DN14714_c20_g1::Rhum_TRINITY_DN14714_c20_g1_i1::g.113407::m.113407/K08830/RAGE, MOK; renal tumor antigen
MADAGSSTPAGFVPGAGGGSGKRAAAAAAALGGMRKYHLLGPRGEGTFSAVLKAECTTTGRMVAIKCMKRRFESVEQVNRLREIQALQRLSPHANVVKLYEVLYDRSTGHLALVFELMDWDLYELVKNRDQPLPDERVLHLIYQLTRAVQHMHKNGIFHRDIKPENILVSGDRLKLTDFGSCRGIYSKQPFTEYIATRWYRAPECLLTDGYYNFQMDLWGIGCVFFEVVALYPLFPGTNEVDQLAKIHRIRGTPEKAVLRRLCQHGSHVAADFPHEAGVDIATLVPHAPPHAADLMTALLAYDPEERVSAKAAIQHPYFKEIRDLDRQLRQQVRRDKEKKQKAEAAQAADAAADTPPRSLKRRSGAQHSPGTASSPLQQQPLQQQQSQATTAAAAAAAAGGETPEGSPSLKEPVLP